MIISLSASRVAVAQSASGTIIVNDSVWKEYVEVGEDVCELVRDDLDSCEYISYEEESDVHVVNTPKDRIYVENQDVTLREQVSAGTDICEYVRTRSEEEDVCKYLRYEPDTRNHHVHILPQTYDYVTLVDKNNMYFGYTFTENEGDHIEAVMEYLHDEGVLLEDVEWVDGYPLNTRGEGDMRYSYKAIVRVHSIDTLAGEK